MHLPKAAVMKKFSFFFVNYLYLFIALFLNHATQVFTLLQSVNTFSLSKFEKLRTQRCNAIFVKLLNQKDILQLGYKSQHSFEYSWLGL